MLDRGDTGDPDPFLSTLARSAPDRLKPMAESILPHLGSIEVLVSRTGLVMLPFRDTVQGTDFFLGEVLVAEAHIRAGTVEGYGMVTGRDLERAMAMAVLDAGRAMGLPEVLAFADREAAVHQAEDTALLRRIEATRVEMETF
jgi:alpha-D-ribose 1-methylphosphonate 5-triphosphate synthase subunit PhnG